MDELFERLSRAEVMLTLNEEEKKRLISACQTEKPKKKTNYKRIAVAAAVLILTVAVFSPGFFLRAGMSDSAANEKGSYEEFCDEIAPQESFDDALFSASGTLTATYRFIYFLIPEQFSSLVGEEEFELWISEDNTDGHMPIVAFVEHFGISKEAFDKANELYAEEIRQRFSVTPLILPADYPEQEKYEVFNSDIIYCGDDEKIGNYYSVPNYTFDSEEDFVAEGEARKAIEFNIK